MVSQRAHVTQQREEHPSEEARGSAGGSTGVSTAAAQNYSEVIGTETTVNFDYYISSGRLSHNPYCPTGSNQ